MVGIAANLLFPPKVASADAGRAIDGLADSVDDLLVRAAAELTELVAEGRDLGPAARAWLGEARRITHDIPQIGAALLHAEQGRRLNVRAMGTPNMGPGLRQGLEALEHSAVAIRGMFRALVDASCDATWLDHEGTDDLLLGLAQTFRELAAGVDAFGQLVRNEADPANPMTAADVQALREALDGLHEARARLEDLMTAGAAPVLLELHAAVLSTVRRLLDEMDLDERVRRQVRLGLLRRRSRRRRPGAPAPVDRPVVPEEPTPSAETQVMPRVPDNPGERPRH